jgi:Icc-related predicted phosphoesterase
MQESLERVKNWIDEDCYYRFVPVLSLLGGAFCDRKEILEVVDAIFQTWRQIAEDVIDCYVDVHVVQGNDQDITICFVQKRKGDLKSVFFEVFRIEKVYR